MDHATDPVSFHRLRSAVQVNAGPADPALAAVVEGQLREGLRASGLFDVVEVEVTQDPDQLVIALCRCGPGVPPWEAGHGLKRVWRALAGDTPWEAHAAWVTEEIADFQGALTLPGGGYVTLHAVAQAAEPTQEGLAGAQALAD